MKPLIIKRNSWLYKIANKSPKVFWGEDIQDICEFRKHVLRGAWEGTKDFICVALGILVGGGIIIGAAGFYLYTTFELVKYACTNAPVTGEVIFGSVANSSILFVLIKYWLDELKRKRKRKAFNQPEKEPGPVKALYLSFKEKYCVPVEIVD